MFKGVQIGAQWDHFAHCTLNIYLMRTDLILGSLIKFRAGTRTAAPSTVSPVHPVNIRALFPVIDKLNQEVAFTITDLN